jgi:ADP-heptose:LPS heptosyltransferase
MILISPFSAKLQKENPKNFPEWPIVVYGLRRSGFHVVQIGTEGERDIGANERKNNLSLKAISQMIAECQTWSSVDNFLPHLAAPLKKPGVVVFSQSDPNIFGYPHNLNLLKDRKYLRPDQFGKWWDARFNPDSFPEPDVVFQAIISLTTT